MMGGLFCGWPAWIAEASNAGVGSWHFCEGFLQQVLGPMLLVLQCTGPSLAERNSFSSVNPRLRQCCFSFQRPFRASCISTIISCAQLRASHLYDRQHHVSSLLAWLAGCMQLFIPRNPAPDPRLDLEAAKARAGDIAFPPGTETFYLGRAHYGCVATVLPPLDGQVCEPPCQFALKCVRALHE